MVQLSGFEERDRQSIIYFVRVVMEVRPQMKSIELVYGKSGGMTVSSSSFHLNRTHCQKWDWGRGIQSLETRESSNQLLWGMNFTSRPTYSPSSLPCRLLSLLNKVVLLRLGSARIRSAFYRLEWFWLVWKSSHRIGLRQTGLGSNLARTGSGTWYY